MACYSNSVKVLCSKVVIGVSVLLFFVGAMCAVFGILQMGLVKPP